MGVIFPLSPIGKLVLILVAIALGAIWSMLVWPDKWKKLLRKDATYLKDGKHKKE